MGIRSSGLRETCPIQNLETFQGGCCLTQRVRDKAVRPWALQLGKPRLKVVLRGRNLHQVFVTFLLVPKTPAPLQCQRKTHKITSRGTSPDWGGLLSDWGGTEGFLEEEDEEKEEEEEKNPRGVQAGSVPRKLAQASKC